MVPALRRASAQFAICGCRPAMKGIIGVRKAPSAWRAAVLRRRDWRFPTPSSTIGRMARIRGQPKSRSGWESARCGNAGGRKSNRSARRDRRLRGGLPQNLLAILRKRLKTQRFDRYSITPILRIIRTIALLVSTFACLSTIVAWIDSESAFRWVGGGIENHPRIRGELLNLGCGVRSSSGELNVSVKCQTISYNVSERSQSLYNELVDSRIIVLNKIRFNTIRWSRGRTVSIASEIRRKSIWQGFGFGLQHDEYGPTVQFTVDSTSIWRIFLPYWVIALGCAVYPIWASVARWSRNRNQNKGECCIRCGYDLRATPLRCPECGLLVSTVGARSVP